MSRKHAKCSYLAINCLWCCFIVSFNMHVVSLHIILRLSLCILLSKACQTSSGNCVKAIIITFPPTAIYSAAIANLPAFKNLCFYWGGVHHKFGGLDKHFLAKCGLNFENRHNTGRSFGEGLGLLYLAISEI